MPDKSLDPNHRACEYGVSFQHHAGINNMSVDIVYAQPYNFTLFEPMQNIYGTGAIFTRHKLRLTSI